MSMHCALTGEQSALLAPLEHGQTDAHEPLSRA